jgi:hypothetical protein
MIAKRQLLFLLILAALRPADASTIFTTDTDWRYLKGLSEASWPDPASWRQIGFDDSGWAIGRAAFYYEDSPGSATAFTGNTALTDMRNGYSCIFLRKAFVVSNPGDISQLELKALSDDGFIAWINGTQVARFNMPDGEIPFNGLSSPALSEPIPVQTYSLDDPRVYLVAGTNVIAVQAFNCSLGGSSDFVISLSLASSVDETPPAVASLNPPAGATVRTLTSIEVAFTEAVTGVDAGDLLINGASATNVTMFSPSQYVFDFAAPATGKVQVAWSSGHGIRDLAGTANQFEGGQWTYTLNPNAPLPGVMISEFMADNRHTLNDEDGDSSDWVELYNSGSTSAALNGWFLSVLTNNPTQWRFPNVFLPPGGYLLVFASQKDRTNPMARLHTNFKLERDCGHLLLLNSETNLVSALSPYPKQYEDVSYGRDRLAPEATGYFTTPTPGGPNSTGGPDFAPEVSFSRSSGTFLSPFSLVLSTPDTNAVIRYTLNGSPPTNTSPAYASPIYITNSVLVRARAFVPGLLPGPPRSETYLLLDLNVVNFTSDLPLLVIHNFGGGLFQANQDKPASLTFFEPKNGVSSLTNSPDLVTRAGLNLRGSSTVGYPKASFSVEFWDEFNDDRSLGVLGMPAESDWVLYAPNNFEPVLIHNPFIHDLSRQIGRYSPRTRFVEVYLNTAGGPVSSANYNGIYVLLEKIKRGPNRVDIDALEPEHTTVPKVTGGYMLKVDRLDPGDSGFYAGGQSMCYVYPKEAVIKLPNRQAQKQYLQSYFDSFKAVLNRPDWLDPIRGYRAYVDVGSWIDHHILNILAFNVDALRLSGFFFKPREGKIGYGPLWDFDRSLGSTDGRDANPRLWRSKVPDYGTDMFNADGIYPNPWFSQLFRDPDFWQAWIDRWQELRQDRFSLANLHGLVDDLVGQVRKAQPREQARWHVTPRGGSYQAEVKLMKDWLASRVDFIDTNFVAKPVFSTSGGPIQPGFTLTVTAGPRSATVYYTIDGSDPRAAGGGVSQNAMVYTAPLTLTANARVVARGYNAQHRNLTGPGNPPLSSPWSGPTAATFVVATPPLVVTELMYSPSRLTTSESSDPDSLEYIELKNIGTEPLNLVGYSFTNGIEFTFTATNAVTSLAPGATVLIVKNKAAFTSRYPGLKNVAGEYRGSLDNNGERLYLEGPLKEPVLDFSYDNKWYPITDGFGFSLVIVNEKAPRDSWGQKSSWRPSSKVGGSPGQDDPPPPEISQVLVNEVLTHTELPEVDAIELYNPNEHTAHIGGWFLTDDFRTPMKYRIPDGKEIPGRGFAVFTEGDFNTGATGSFALSALGDEVYLFSGDALTNLTGYYHGFEFGTAESGVSFGRYVISTGEEHFVPQVTSTLNAPNAGPRVGPVVFNEIMFNPPPILGTNNNVRDEYVELRNISSQPVPLFDPNAPTNTWRIDGGIRFTFPANLSMPPDAYWVVVGFDSNQQPSLFAEFSSSYKLPPGAVILGPYEGRLENVGERLRLLKPEPPEPATSPNAGLVPYVQVDEVNYSNASPWPAGADGTGKSLQRRVSRNYGNDPINWQSASPTPAAPNAVDNNLDSDNDGLPDAWELANNLNPNDATGDEGAEGDPDTDGFSNLQEYVAGTDPRDAASRLKVNSITLSDNSTVIRFTAVAGKTYSLLWSEDVANGPWLKVQDISAQVLTQELAVSDSNALRTMRFYRLVTPHVP